VSIARLTQGTGVMRHGEIADFSREFDKGGGASAA
jgi:hypothetical protein